MRSLLLTSSTLFLLAGGSAFALNNSTGLGQGNAAATTGGTAATNGGVAVSLGTLLVGLDNVGNEYLHVTRTDLHIDVKAVAVNNGKIEKIAYINVSGQDGLNAPKYQTGGDATMIHSINGNTGVTTTQVNTAASALQQNSVAFSSYIGGNSGTSP